MSTRREFLKTGAVVGGLGLLGSGCTGALESKPGYFGLHPFIEKNPKAVFIKKTNVPVKTDWETKKKEGITFAREVFVLKSEGGIPTSHKIVIKPNLTCNYSKTSP